MRPKRLAGFTLVELLITVVILGILGSIAMPRFFPQKEKGIVAEAVSMLSAIREGEEAYRIEHGGYFSLWPVGWQTAEWEKLGIEDPNNARWDYGTTGGGQAIARRKTGAYAGTLITLEPETGVWGGDHPYRPTNVP